MFNYVVRRTLQAIPLLIVISFILFVILHSAPGGGLGPYLQNPHITAADIARLKHNLGYDRPLPEQYVRWLGHIVTGDFGYSTSNSEPVFNAITERLPATLELMISSFILAFIIGVSAGLFSAVRPYSVWDYGITTFAFFGQSMPVFWFALMMQLAFAVHGIPLPGGWLIQLPSAGISSGDNFDLGDRIQHLILPCIVLALLQVALYSRFMRSSMLEVIKTDYMRTAWAKGLNFRTVLFKHGLKNALIPLVTVTALTLPGLFGGAILTESIFAWPGEGRLFLQALGQQDISVMMGYLVFNAFLVVFANLLADVCYAWLDPRVKYD
ncbi:MAG TPA: ABC transporter permease [Candidatus Baltobacteraceae bacterium]|nr:ABC transporter permease [Candidatus Baltobacteraceae bacterium]